MKSITLLAIVISVSTFGGATSAQTQAGLDIHLYAGLTITGRVGTVYSIDYVTAVSQTNNASAWRCLEFLQLPKSPYIWVDSSAAATSNRFYRAVTFAGPGNLVFIPAGTFRMGSPTNEVGHQTGENPQTEVTISRGFWMGKYEVTQREYQGLMATNPSFFTGDVSLPVETVSWFDATNYCARLTQQEVAAGRIPSHSSYRLPTEAEWEYACRAWTSTRFSFGDDPEYISLTNYAWCALNSGGSTHPVGQLLPNPWGLFDMHGNVLEWCQDWSTWYQGGAVVDPQGPATGYFRCFRGGTWVTNVVFGRSALRFNSQPQAADNSLGFRVVLAAGL